MNGEKIAEKLGKCQYKIIFTSHANLRLFERQVSKELVVDHLRNPQCLRLAERLAPEGGKEKYKLWFIPSKRTAYIYVITIDDSQEKIIVLTVIKQRLAWQKRVEK